MMAAAARTSGTRSPLASTLYRGSGVSAISRAIATARARARLAFRADDRDAEYRVRGRAGVLAEAGATAGRFAFVSASTVPTPILTRPTSTNDPTRKGGLLITFWHLALKFSGGRGSHSVPDNS